ncbi:MAG TPA: hypothetical protein VLW85_20755 [Myxococcales bacterium]|nr:hypothetical protein [Myxococcales bacterium]
MSSRRLLALALLAAGAARADGSATTFFDSRPYVRDSGYQEEPIFESFSLFARADGGAYLQDVRIVARGWGRVTLGLPLDDHRTAGDVDSLFFEGRLFQRHLTLRLGRQMVTGGAARATQIDGAFARIVAKGVGAELYGGVPVDPRFAAARGDAIAGGRLFWNPAFDSELGASAVYALKRGYVARKDAGFDASVTPVRPLTLSGLAQWSVDDRRLEEARLAALVQLAPQLQIVGDVQRTAPDLFIDRNSIFAVFAEELRDEAGGEIVLRPLRPLSLSADWHWLRVEGGHGQRGGFRGTLRTGEDGSLGVELRLLTQPDNGYKEARLFWIRRLDPAFTLTVDLDGYWLERELSLFAQKRSLVATGTLGWAVDEAWEAMLAGSYGTTPYFEQRAEVAVRVAWKFGMPGGAR